MSQQDYSIMNMNTKNERMFNNFESGVNFKLHALARSKPEYDFANALYLKEDRLWTHESHINYFDSTYSVKNK
jgi:hypothetical protein